MTAELVFQQALNGLSFGALLFILASGLSLVFGMMDVVNLAHGAFYMLGAYVALSVVQLTGSFWLAMLAAPFALGLLGFALEPLLLRRLRGRHLDQVLLTIGVSLVIVDVIGQVWGREVRSLSAPAGLDGSVMLIGGVYPVYRLFVMAFGVALAAAMAVVYRRTRIGMLIRAGVQDAEMLGALGVNTNRLFASTFATGAALAGLAGVIAAPVFGVQPGMDTDPGLLYSLVVVVVGGLGTLSGAVAGSVLVGPADTFGKVLFQDVALAVIFAIVALVLGVLVVRSEGIFFLMLTLALAQIVFAIAFQWTAVTGGSNGLAGVGRPMLASLDFSAPDLMYVLVAVTFVLVALAVWGLARSTYGRALIGVRENERRMRALGYDTARLRLSAFVLAGTIAGIAGALSAYSTRFVSAQDAGLGNSVRAFVTVLVGGAGTLGGPILGSALVSLIERVVPSLLPTDLRISEAILGIIFIAFVLFARQGMVGLGRFALLRVSRR